MPLGIRKIRLTGGEPLMRPKLPDLVAKLSAFRSSRSRAHDQWRALADLAKPLHDAGLRRLNIHLDTLDRGRFEKISRRDELARVWPVWKPPRPRATK